MIDQSNTQDMDAGKPGIAGKGTIVPKEEQPETATNIVEPVKELSEEMSKPLTKTTGSSSTGEDTDEANKEAELDYEHDPTEAAPQEDELSDSVDDGEPVEYNAGAEDLMADLAAKDCKAEMAEPKDIPVEAKGPDYDKNNPPPKKLIHPKPVFTNNPELRDSTKPGFNPDSKQDARHDSNNEGGVARPRTTGPQKTDGDASKEGNIIRPTKPPTNLAGTYEVSGFSVSYEEQKGGGLVSREIRDYFNDMETAQASVNGDRYLMPILGGGFKVATITSGAPNISFEDRVLYQYLNEKNKWSRV